MCLDDTCQPGPPSDCLVIIADVTTDWMPAAAMAISLTKALTNASQYHISWPFSYSWIHEITNKTCSWMSSRWRFVSFIIHTYFIGNYEMARLPGYQWSNLNAMGKFTGIEIKKWQNRSNVQSSCIANYIYQVHVLTPWMSKLLGTMRSRSHQGAPTHMFALDIIRVAKLSQICRAN